MTATPCIGFQIVDSALAGDHFGCETRVIIDPGAYQTVELAVVPIPGVCLERAGPVAEPALAFRVVEVEMRTESIGSGPRAPHRNPGIGGNDQTP